MSRDTELAEELRQALEAEPPTLPPLLELREPDLADVMNQLSIAEAAHVVKHLPSTGAVRVFDQPELRHRAAILEELDPGQAAAILEHLSADERTQILRRLSPHERHRLVPSLSVDVRAEVQQLLQYPAKSAGGIMTTEFVRLEPTMTVAQALDRIRAEAAEKETIYAC